MVVFGRSKGRRGSYRQWQEGNIAPQVVFEILSPSNTVDEMDRKLEFDDTDGVEEYYLYDPETFQFDGWLRQGEHRTRSWDIHSWVSPRLNVRFETGQGELAVYHPNGQPFLSSVEREQQREQEQQRAEQEQQRAEQERQRAEQERQRAEQLAAYLRSIGVDPDNLPQ